MSRKLKILGICTLATLALSALGASAQAATPEFHCTSTTANCFATGSSSNASFEIASPNLMHLGCKESGGTPGLQLKATATKTASVLDAIPSFSGCTYVGFNAAVNTNGCFFRFKLVEGTKPATATVDIVCPAGRKIVITMPGLEAFFEIGAQTGLSHAVLTNTGTEPTGVEAAMTITGLTYTTAGVISQGTNIGTFSNGEFAATVPLSGFNDEGGVEGNKVGFHVF